MSKPKNEYKYLEGKVVRLKENCCLYKSDIMISHSKEAYVIKFPNEFGGRVIQYLPKGSKMHIDKMKHLRSLQSDRWYPTGRIYIDGRVYNCAYGMHMSYLELIENKPKR